ncbi:hypothetical protein [Pontibacter liquoris]|uniref:hypothetical protein n=1 Tax=Pontibacter liquoris TaxID=2905677 RepID=UPI001FA79593|nr:hypothetical protein [Pontibacter liquoris]
MLKRILFLSILLCGVSIVSRAQVYRTAAGVRLDSDVFGLTLQQKLHEQGTLEAILALSAREYSATALYEWHRPILGKRFNYYLGAGGHVGNLKDNGMFTGVDGIIGVEYKVNGLPFLLSADVKPAVHFHHEDWTDFSTGISVRYVIVKEKKKKKSLWPFGKQQDEDNKRDRKKGSIFDRLKQDND